MTTHLRYLHSPLLTLSFYGYKKKEANINSHQVEVPAHVAYELCIMACRFETFPKYISIIRGTLFALRITTNICPSDNIFLCCLLACSAVFYSALFSLCFYTCLLLWLVGRARTRSEPKSKP